MGPCVAVLLVTHILGARAKHVKNKNKPKKISRQKKKKKETHINNIYIGVGWGESAAREGGR